MMTAPRLDPSWLDSFLAVSRAASFTEAASQLNLRQSTVSQHIRRLEDAVGRRLFIRDTHSVRLTPDGDAMVEFARGIVAANERAHAHFAHSQVRGRLRFGASEDFVLTGLPELLRNFMRNFPLVDLELTVGLSGTLHERLAAGEMDLVLAKRRPGEDQGTLLWRDSLAWIGAEGFTIDAARPLPLVVFPPPSITRAVVLETLERAGRPWHIACTSGSLTGLRAAALAGLGVIAHASQMVPEGLRALPAECGLPPMGDVEFVLLASRRPGPAAAELSALIRRSGRMFAAPG